MEKKFLEYSEYPKTFIQYTNSTILINYDIVQSTRTIEDKEETIYTSKYICFFARIYTKRFMTSTFVGCKITKFSSNNSYIIHKKVYSNNLF